MALKGTLKDFGIADILQLIGQQQKTGALVLTHKQDAVAVTFKDGNILRAETTSRNRKDLIGSMLVAASLVTEQQLEFALETQKRTLQRLGDVLVSQGVLTEHKFKSMVQLQTSETLFKLFAWKAGTYEFEQKDVETENTLTPLRAESVLMEGFRRVDEWRVLERTIGSFDAVLIRDDLVLRSIDMGTLPGKEKVMLDAVDGSHTVRQIIAASHMSSFDACRVLVQFLEARVLRRRAAP